MYLCLRIQRGELQPAFVPVHLTELVCLPGVLQTDSSDVSELKIHQVFLSSLFLTAEFFPPWIYLSIQTNGVNLKTYIASFSRYRVHKVALEWWQQYPNHPFRLRDKPHNKTTWRNCFHNKQHSHLFLFDPHPRQNSKLKYSMPSWALASSGLPELELS